MRRNISLVAVFLLMVSTIPLGFAERARMPGKSVENDGAWLLLPATFPDDPHAARHTYAAILDAPRNRMVLFGGSDGSIFRNDSFELRLGLTPSWSMLTPSGATPPPRRLVEGIYDPLRDQMIVFGGVAGSLFNDVWALSLAGAPAWTRIEPSGPSPAPRAGHSLVYDPDGDRMILFGGFDGVSAPAQRRNDVWALSLYGTPTWTEITPVGPGPSARSSHSAVYDTARHRMVIFGGTDPAYRNDTWALSLTGSPAWTMLTPSGTPPPVREEQSVIYDPRGDRLILFGGTDGIDDFGDVWFLQFGTDAWVRRPPTPASPLPRWGHGAIDDPVADRMILFGGIGARDTWSLTWGRQAGVNYDPDCSQAVAVLPAQWKSRSLAPIGISGLSDPDGDATTVTATGVLQDEPVVGAGGRSCPDAALVAGVASVRMERDPHGDGRVYRVAFTAEDGRGGSCAGAVAVCVPRVKDGGCVDDGAGYDSLGACPDHPTVPPSEPLP
jgi:hypothetical protein